jgi:hypothetical protein
MDHHWGELHSLIKFGAVCLKAVFHQIFLTVVRRHSITTCTCRSVLTVKRMLVKSYTVETANNTFYSMFLTLSDCCLSSLLHAFATDAICSSDYRSEGSYIYDAHTEGTGQMKWMPAGVGIHASVYVHGALLVFAVIYV